jgi:hypothetical protein
MKIEKNMKHSGGSIFSFFLKKTNQVALKKEKNMDALIQTFDRELFHINNQSLEYFKSSVLKSSDDYSSLKQKMLLNKIESTGDSYKDKINEYIIFYIK